MNSEEEKRFRELLRKEDGPLNTYPFDPKTSSVQPSTEHPQTKADYANTTTGRGNTHEPFGFILPRIPGFNSPSPTPVETGSRIVVPSTGEPYLEQARTTPGRGNPYPPFGRISPRTAGGADANPEPGDNELPDAIAQQIKKPIDEQPYTKPLPRSKNDIAKGVS